MLSLKQQALEAISRLPDAVDLEEIMYRLYVIDKIQRGLKSAEDEALATVDEVREETESW